MYYIPKAFQVATRRTRSRAAECTVQSLSSEASAQQSDRGLMREAHPDQTGLLVVKHVIPGSAAGEFLQPGDILLRVNGNLTAKFVPLAAALDESVGESVNVLIERGGVALAADLVVDDLHAISPDEFIEFGEGIFHDLSYQQARHFNRGISGVYVA